MAKKFVAKEENVLPLAVVTGANRGIGQYVAEELSKSGKYRVCAVCREATAAEKVGDALVKLSPHGEKARVRPVVLDLKEPISGPIVNEAISLLVNNAGVRLTSCEMSAASGAVLRVLMTFVAQVMFEKWTEACFDECRRVNVLAPLELIQHSIFVEGARVINVRLRLLFAEDASYR